MHGDRHRAEQRAGQVRVVGRQRGADEHRRTVCGRATAEVELTGCGETAPGREESCPEHPGDCPGSVRHPHADKRPLPDRKVPGEVNCNHWAPLRALAIVRTAIVILTVALTATATPAAIGQA